MKDKLRDTETESVCSFFCFLGTRDDPSFRKLRSDFTYHSKKGRTAIFFGSVTIFYAQRFGFCSGENDLLSSCSFPEFHPRASYNGVSY